MCSVLTARFGIGGTRACPCQLRQPELEDVLEVRDIGAGDAVAVGRERHGLKQTAPWAWR